MPLTLAHPAAILPIHRRLGPWTVPSALVIGSITPDLAYFLPLHVPRDDSHSILGLVWFCLPVGLVMYLLFHGLLKQPLLSIAPIGVQRRAAGIASASRAASRATWTAVLASLLLGAATHLAWDGFTHGSGAAVRAIPGLRAHLFSARSYNVFIYTVLQHTSTVVGVTALGWWGRRWWQRTAPQHEPPAPLAAGMRWSAVALLLGLPCAYAIGVVALDRTARFATAQQLAGRGTIAFVSAFGVVLLAFALWWHLGARRVGLPHPRRACRAPADETGAMPASRPRR